MSLIPWEYVKENLFLPAIYPVEVAKKLTYHGLETKVIEKDVRPGSMSKKREGNVSIVPWKQDIIKKELT